LLAADGSENDWPPFNAYEEFVEFETDLGPASVHRRLKPRAVSFWNAILPQIYTCSAGMAAP
jgi:carboxylesterase 2